MQNVEAIRQTANPTSSGSQLPSDEIFKLRAASRAHVLPAGAAVLDPDVIALMFSLLKEKLSCSLCGVSKSLFDITRLGVENSFGLELERLDPSAIVSCSLCDACLSNKQTLIGNQGQHTDLDLDRGLLNSTHW
jgi:hypothetical protein